MSNAPLGSISPEDASDDDSTFGKGYGYGLRVTMNTPGYYGHELSYVYNRVDFQTRVRTQQDTAKRLLEDKIRIQQASYNFLIYFMPKGERWRPFMTGGLQLYQYGAPKIADWTRGSSRNYGANYGAGLKLKLFEHALIRLDFRDYIGGKPFDLESKDPLRSGGLIHQLEASFGIAIGF